jgi:hypothetical protein
VTTHGSSPCWPANPGLRERRFDCLLFASNWFGVIAVRDDNERRRGCGTKHEICAIRISERETRFEIARHAAERFAVAAGRPDPEDASVRIERLRADRPADAPRATASTARPRH